MLLSVHLALQALGFSETSDTELVDLYLATRGERYFAELYRRYSTRVYGKCLTMLNDSHEAHDAVQEVFERVLLRVGSFKRNASFSTWLFAITNNHCIDRLRKRNRARAKLSSVPVEDVELGAEVDEGPDWLEEQSPAAIRHILAELGELDRAALVLMYMDDLSVREIAATLQLGESATKMRLKRARARARKIYDLWRVRSQFAAA